MHLAEGSCAAAKRGRRDEITLREVTVLRADFATVWSELFPGRAGKQRRTLHRQPTGSGLRAIATVGNAI
jgi:hypothetical protein